MGVKRRQHDAGFKARIALEAVKQEKTIAQLSSGFGVHANMIAKWKKQLLTELPVIFSKDYKKADKEAETLIDELYKQIGQLKVELDWLKKKSKILC
jgi:putative transposase